MPTATPTATKALTGTTKTPKVRSPNFPAVNLKTAMDAVAKIHAKYRRHEVPLRAIYAELELKETSSYGGQLLAAMKSYGLVGYSGKGKDRKVVVSASGERIVGHAPDRAALIKVAALAPAAFRELWARYEKTGLPPDNLIEQYLKWDRPGPKFTDDAIRVLIANLKETISFANLSTGDIIPPGAGEQEEQQEEDEATDGAETLLPPTPEERQPRPRVQRGASMSEKAREEVFVVPEGGEVVLQFPGQLSRATFDDLQDWLKITVRKIGRLVRDEIQVDGEGERSTNT